MTTEDEKEANRRVILESSSATGNRMGAGNTSAEHGSKPHAVPFSDPKPKSDGIVNETDVNTWPLNIIEALIDLCLNQVLVDKWSGSGRVSTG
jgi:hypothetical protein